MGVMGWMGGICTGFRGWEGRGLCDTRGVLGLVAWRGGEVYSDAWEKGAENGVE